MDEAIVNYLKRKYNLLIGKRTAEQIKIEIDSAYALDKPLTMEIKGRSLIEGRLKTITVDDVEIHESPPTSSHQSHTIDRGIVLAGGGALLKNLDKQIREETGLPVCIADDQLCCVVLGTSKILSDFKLLRRVSIE